MANQVIWDRSVWDSTSIRVGIIVFPFFVIFTLIGLSSLAVNVSKSDSQRRSNLLVLIVFWLVSAAYLFDGYVLYATKPWSVSSLVAQKSIGVSVRGSRIHSVRLSNSQKSRFEVDEKVFINLNEGECFQFIYKRGLFLTEVIKIIRSTTQSCSSDNSDPKVIDLPS
jgi:hypothetical protein